MHAAEELVHPSDTEASREDTIYTPQLLGTGQRNSGLKLDIKNLLMVLRNRVEQTGNLIFISSCVSCTRARFLDSLILINLLGTAR